MARPRVSDDHPLRDFFQSLVHDSLALKMGLRDRDVEDYLCGLITDFIHADAELLPKHDQDVDDLAEMLQQGDVRLGAESFDEERRVHKHIGDYVMFWGGVFPEHFDVLRRKGDRSGLLDPVERGKASYYLVSTFVHGDYASEASLFRKLSKDFEAYLFALHLVRQAWEDGSGDWGGGFDA